MKERSVWCIAGLDNEGRCAKGWQNVVCIIKAQVRGFFDTHGPGSHPTVEWLLCVLLQSPATMGAGGGVMGEEHRQHFRPTHDAEKLGMVSNFRDIVGCWRRGTAESVRGLCKQCDELVSRLSIQRLQNTALIQDNRAKVSRVEMIEHFIVGDVDARSEIVP